MKSKTAALKILKKDWPARPAAIEKEEETKNRIWTATPALLRVYDSGNQEEMRNMIICRHLHIVLPDVNGGGGAALWGSRAATIHPSRHSENKKIRL